MHGVRFGRAPLQADFLVRMGNRANEGHAEVTVLVYLMGVPAGMLEA
jgi:hypothetical protein